MTVPQMTPLPIFLGYSRSRPRDTRRAGAGNLQEGSGGFLHPTACAVG